MNKQKVWLVTGASKGLGLNLVKKLLAEGYPVAATSRNKAALITEIGDVSEHFLALEVDIVNEQSVKDAITQLLSHFGQLDVVVNNAGYGQIGTLEELSDEEVRRNHEVNVFGLLHVIRHVMPHFRAKRSGNFFNISSIGGYTGGFPGWGIYCSTKFAVSGLTESLAAEVKSFGVKVTLVYPGYFRTNFLSKESIMTPAHPIAAYEEARQSQAFHQNEVDGNQPGDPEKVASVLIQIANEEKPPLHLFLGHDAYKMAYQKIEAVEAELELWKNQTLSTAF
ncbi:MAG: SDR family NAD(P)-dependent oxidoreductase [Bacteroidia bacterium]|nr:SDR family NAD(P)-dependent oxidoreductase [Bacteroidia bacterium]